MTSFEFMGGGLVVSLEGSFSCIGARHGLWNLVPIGSHINNFL